MKICISIICIIVMWITSFFCIAESKKVWRGLKSVRRMYTVWVLFLAFLITIYYGAICVEQFMI